MAKLPVFEQWTDGAFYGAVKISSGKSFKNPDNGRKIPVYVWKGMCEEFNYTVSAGANSDYSYTGLCVGCTTLEQAKEYIERENPKGNIIK